MYILYGIKNCDTIKKARAWLNEHSVIYQFNDYQVEGLTHDTLQNFIARLGWKELLNQCGKTWRQLNQTERIKITDAENAQIMMLQKPAMIKRPVLQSPNGALLLGFDIEQYKKFLGCL